MVSIVQLLLSDGKEMKHPFSFVPSRSKEGSALQIKLQTQPPHHFITHLPFNVLAKSFGRYPPKVIYMVRNPFDQLVSYYNFYKMHTAYGLYTGSWNEFYENLYRKNILFYGNHLDHVAGWWKAKEDYKDCILYVKYEDIIRDPKGILNQIASFLGKALSEDVIESIVQKSSFQSMKNIPKEIFPGVPDIDESVSKFMRKGIVGDWKNYFNERQEREVEEEYEQKIKILGLVLDREI